MDFSRLHRAEALGVAGAVLLLVGLLLFNWYSLGETPNRLGAEADPDAFICGTGNFECTGFDTFPILRWLLIAGCFAPLILAWIVVRGHKLSWPPGEVTMIVGFSAIILIAYNGIIDRPGTGAAEISNSIEIGYWLGLLGAIGIAAGGLWRASVPDRPQAVAVGQPGAAA
jgi:hypothetical protein